ACAGLPCLGWFDSYQVQIVPFIASAFSIFLMRQFFLSIPSELSDAARMDGAGHLRFLWSIVLPLSVPALITAGLITFLGSWNAFQWPLIVTSKPDFRPVQVGLSAFRQEAGSSYHLLMAASTFVVAPIVVLFLVAHRYLLQGIARTGIRGRGARVDREEQGLGAKPPAGGGQEGTRMRLQAGILATLLLVIATSCSAAAPAPQQSTEADITLSGPVNITLWHALSGPQQVALDAMVKKF